MLFFFLFVWAGQGLSFPWAATPAAEALNLGREVRVREIAHRGVLYVAEVAVGWQAVSRIKQSVALRASVVCVCRIAVC